MIKPKKLMEAVLLASLVALAGCLSNDRADLTDNQNTTLNWHPGFPTWMGVYGVHQRHSGGNPGTFTILMNRDFWGLQAEVGIRVGRGSWKVHPMVYSGNYQGNSIWKFTPPEAFLPGVDGHYYFHGFDAQGAHIWDSQAGRNYEFTMPMGYWFSQAKIWDTGELRGLVSTSQGLRVFTSQEMRRSFDQGQTWSAPEPLPLEGGSLSRVLSDGRFIHLVISRDNRFYTLSSLDDGRWGALKAIPETGSVGSLDLAAYDGVLHAAWVSSGGYPGQGRVAASRKLAGGDWSWPGEVADRGEYPLIAASDSGIHMAYTTYGQAHTLRSVDGGNTWGWHGQFSTETWAPTRYGKLRADAAYVYFAYNDFGPPESSKLYFRRKHKDATQWEAGILFHQHRSYKVTVHMKDFTVRGSHVFVLANPQGWYGGSGPYQLFQSTDGGRNWGDVTPAIPTRGSSSPGSMAQAELSVSPDGKAVHLAQLVHENNGTGIYHSLRDMPAPGWPVGWIGNARHWPENGTLGSEDALWLNIESYPQGAALSVQVVYTVNGLQWQTRELGLAGTAGNNDWWHLSLGKFSSGAHIEYAFKVVDGLGRTHWYSNSGQNLHAHVH